LVFSELEYLSQEDLDGATRFKVPTSGPRVAGATLAT
jgi:hypothetical protein